jgi:hypothetical protein
VCARRANLQIQTRVRNRVSKISPNSVLIHIKRGKGTEF